MDREDTAQSCILRTARDSFTKRSCLPDTKTTNNRMELMAAIVALEALNRPCEVDLYSGFQILDRCLQPALDRQLGEK